MSTALIIIKLIYQVYEGMKSNNNYKSLNQLNEKIITKLKKVKRPLQNYLRNMIENSKNLTQMNFDNILENNNKDKDKEHNKIQIFESKL